LHKFIAFLHHWDIPTPKPQRTTSLLGEPMPKPTFYNLAKSKQSLILQIAAREFAAHAYDAASISNITRITGIAKGSFYQYFSNKQDLYQTLIEHATEIKLDLINELPAPDPASDLFDTLKRQFLGTALFELRHPNLARVLYRAFVEEVPFPEMTEELRRRGTTQFFKQLIAQGITHGDVAVWVDPDAAAFLMETVFYQFGKYLIERLDLAENQNLETTILEDEKILQILNNLMDLLEAGIKRDPQQRRDYYPKD
jgi:AcrR family transcriptional regulator